MKASRAIHAETFVAPDDSGFARPDQAPAKSNGTAMALLALSHTAVEHRVYTAMRSALQAEGKDAGPFGIRCLTSITGLSSHSSVRRACTGLLDKLSIEEMKGAGEGKSIYRVYGPEDIFRRRAGAGLEPYPAALQRLAGSGVAELLLADVAGRCEISRREALVALYCAEGLTNTEIGERLGISGRTVKYHLRQLFGKLKIKRRSEVIARLLARPADQDWAVPPVTRSEGAANPPLPRS